MSADTLTQTAATTQASGTPGAAPHPGTLELAGRTVSRVGFGAARLTAGDGWGVPVDPEQSKRLLLDAVNAGFGYVDTADALGPGVSEQLIGDALGARDDVLVATKIGMLRPAANQWGILGHPDYLRQQIQLSLQRLRRERIELLYLHRIDPNFPLEDQIGVLQDARDRGDVGAIGVSEPSTEQLDAILALEPGLAAVQSLYNLAARQNDRLIARLGERGIPFIAYWPLIGRGLRPEHKSQLFAELERIGAPLELSAHQLSLAWIFTTQPHALAVVGSRSSAHLAENQRAADAKLDPAVVAEIDAAVTATIGGTPFDPRYPEHD